MSQVFTLNFKYYGLGLENTRCMGCSLNKTEVSKIMDVLLILKGQFLNGAGADFSSNYQRHPKISGNSSIRSLMGCCWGVQEGSAVS